MVVRLLGGLAITVMTLYCSPRGRTGKGRGSEGSGLYPELAAYRISEGSSPNVQAEVGRLVGQLPIEQARAELARRGIELDEKTVRRIAVELGEQMLATRTRDLVRFRAGELPAGNEFAGKRLGVGIDGGRVRVRTVVEKIRVSGKKKRRKFKIEWREPKVMILFEIDEKGRMVRGSRPVIDGTLQGPDALIELVAFHLHRMGAAKAKVVIFLADGAPWIWARLDWVIAQAKLEPARVVEVLDWCHGVHHLSLALAALDLDEDRRGELYGRLRGLLKKGKSKVVLGRARRLGEGPVRRFARVARDPLLEEALRGGTAAVRLFPLPGPADRERCDREHDPSGDQPSTQGEQHLLDGGQCGGGVPTTRRSRFRAVGGDRGTHSGGDGQGSSDELALDTTGMPGRVEGARQGERRFDATINEETS